MDARLNYYGNTVAAKFAKYINSAGAVVSNSTLPAATQELVKIRGSQINGCAACTDMHTKDAEHAGERSVQLNLVAVWREARVFTEAERAALDLTEQGTRIADAAGGVTDAHRYAALRAKLRMKTLPHLQVPILLLDAAVFWLAAGSAIPAMPGSPSMTPPLRCSS